MALPQEQDTPWCSWSTWNFQCKILKLDTGTYLCGREHPANEIWDPCLLLGLQSPVWCVGKAPLDPGSGQRTAPWWKHGCCAT